MSLLALLCKKRMYSNVGRLMKRWFFLLLIGVVLLAVPRLQAQITTYTDDFNRTTLGSAWHLDAEWYQIVSGALDNTLTVASWDYYAIYLALTNPTEVSYTFIASGDMEGTNSAGTIMRYDLVSKSGYFIYRRYGDLTLHPITSGIIQRNAITIASVPPTQPYPKPGDTMKVVATSDAGGHHFKLYINGLLDGTLTDAAKSYGNGSTLYGGVALYGQRNNNIDNFTVKGTPPATPVETIGVTYPNGGEILLIGSSQAITWSSSNLTNNVKIELSTNGGATYSTLATVPPAPASYTWTVPNTPSTTCRIRIADAVDNVPLDISNANFTIATPPDLMEVTSPNGGEDLYSGTTIPITWTTTLTGGSVKIEYSTDGGSTYNIIAASAPNSGTYSWLVPAMNSGICRIRVSGAPSGVPSDVSDSNFTMHITPPDLTVIRPNGGDNWLVGAQQEIQWTGPDATTMPAVNILYSVDGGGTWNSVAANEINDGAYTWTVPNEVTVQALIRIQDAGGVLPSDQSDTYFSISTLVRLQVKDSSGQPGSTGNKVSIVLDNLTNVRGLSFRVTDSPNMLTAMNVTPVNRALSFSVTKVDNGTHVTIYMVSMSAGVITIGSGPIATISYDVSASAPVGDYAELSLSEVTVADANSQPIVPDLIDGKFFFVMKGDILADGIVDSPDLERAIQLLLKTGAPMTPTELLCGDLDADGDFDLIDFMNIWEMIY